MTSKSHIVSSTVCLSYLLLSFTVFSSHVSWNPFCSLVAGAEDPLLAK